MDPWMTPEEAANYTGYSVLTLLAWRAKGTGPRYWRRADGRAVRYRKSWIDEWMEEHGVVAQPDQHVRPQQPRGRSRNPGQPAVDPWSAILAERVQLVPEVLDGCVE